MLLIFFGLLKLCCVSGVLSFDPSEAEGYERPPRKPKTIKLGHLSGYNDIPKTGPAISLALERFQAEGNMLDYDFEVTYKLVRDCRQDLGVAAVMDMYREGVDVVLGPYCGDVCIAAGYVMRYFNLLHLPSSCTNAELNDKNVFNTLIRPSAGMHKMGEAMKLYLDQQGWGRVFLWHRDSGSCQFGADDMADDLPRLNITIAERVRVGTGFSEPIPRAWILETLSKIRERARVVLLCCHHNDMWRIMKEAADAGMTSSDYNWIYYNNNPSAVSDAPWTKIDETLQPAEAQTIKEAFLSMKQLHFAQMNNADRHTFNKRMIERATKAPWNMSMDDFSLAAYNLHDGTYLYLLLVNETLAAGGDVRDGRKLALAAHGMEFPGASGYVRIGNNGDRNPDYVITQYTPELDGFVEYAQLQMAKPVGQQYIESMPPWWNTPDGLPALDIPECGLSGLLCPEDNSSRDVIIIAVVVAVLLGVLFASGTVYIARQRKLEKELQLMLWKISYADLAFTGQAAGSLMGVNAKSLRSIRSVDTDVMRNSRHTHGSSDPSGNVYDYQQNEFPNDPWCTKNAYHRGQLVTVQFFSKQSVDLSRVDLIELKWTKDLSHDNVVVFLGACIDPPNICSVYAYCSKGTLQDVIENDDIKLDWMFKSSLMADLANGLCYLHDSQFLSHGQLKSSSCLIDSRWVLKISDYGLGAFRILRRKEPIENEYTYCRELLWTAPELLRITQPPVYGTQAGDIHSLGIILQELVYRALPFFYGPITPQEIVRLLRVSNDKADAAYRPELPRAGEEGAEGQVVALMRSCWSESPSSRPSARDVRRTLRNIGGRKPDIVDAMLNKLEKYATNLEELVSRRTSELVDEKKKTDVLLYRMLPRTVAEKLKKGMEVEPEVYANVTIYFSDVVGFTQISSESTPIEVVNFLNDLYTTFDNIIDKHSVYKVETIGDAYMVVGGLPNRTNNHAANIADMSLEILSEVSHFRIRHVPDQKLRVRIGLHTGSCAAGIVGHVMPRYCLFGDTVNVASRMESTGEALRIHVSESTKEALSSHGVYHLKSRGAIELKGKGLCTTFWLTEKEGQTKNFHLVD